MTGIPVLDKLLAAITFLACAGVVGIFIYSEKVYQRPLPEDEWEFVRMQKEINREITGKTFKLDKLNINIKGRVGNLRYLSIEVHFLPFKDKFFVQLENNAPMLYDTVIRIAGVMSPEELNSVAGKILLETRIKKEVNALLGRAIIKKIYFTTFVIQ